MTEIVPADCTGATAHTSWKNSTASRTITITRDTHLLEELEVAVDHLVARDDNCACWRLAHSWRRNKFPDRAGCTTRVLVSLFYIGRGVIWWDG